MLLPVVVHVVLMFDNVISLGQGRGPVLLLFPSTTTTVLQDFFVIYILILIIAVKVVIH